MRKLTRFTYQRRFEFGVFIYWYFRDRLHREDCPVRLRFDTRDRSLFAERETVNCVGKIEVSRANGLVDKLKALLPPEELARATALSITQT